MRTPDGGAPLAGLLTAISPGVNKHMHILAYAICNPGLGCGLAAQFYSPRRENPGSSSAASTFYKMKRERS